MIKLRSGRVFILTANGHRRYNISQGLKRHYEGTTLKQRKARTAVMNTPEVQAYAQERATAAKQTWAYRKKMSRIKRDQHRRRFVAAYLRAARAGARDQFLEQIANKNYGGY